MKRCIGLERNNLLEPNVYIGMVIKLSGTVTKNAVCQAVQNAYAANEATMSKIILDERGNAYYETMDYNGCKFIYDNRDWQVLMKESEKNTFAINEGELVRIYMTEYNQNPIILIHAHHLVGDGKSILILLDDIMKSLDGQQLTYKPMILINREYLHKRAHFNLFERLATMYGNLVWKRKERIFTWEDYYAIHKEYWGNHISDIKVRTYPVSELKNQCVDGVTINSYLITMLLRENPQSKLVGIPVSIREDNRSMSNQTSGFNISCQYRPEDSFEENMVLVHNKIYNKLKNKTQKYRTLLFMDLLSKTLTDAVLMNVHNLFDNKKVDRLAVIMGFSGKYKNDFGLSNLNRIHIEDTYTQFKVEDILFIPPKVSYSKRIFGVSTYGEKLTMCFHDMIES